MAKVVILSISMAKVMMMMMMVILGCSLIKGTMAVMDETNVIHVGGKVMCQDCSQAWNDWVKGGKPIKGATVSVTCLDERKRVACYESDKTDEEGEFNMLLHKIVHGKTIDPRHCVVRLVSSSDPTCNVPTDFPDGDSGVKLTQPSVVYRDITKYMLGPFFYTTPACKTDDEPSTDHQGSS